MKKYSCLIGVAIVAGLSGMAKAAVFSDDFSVTQTSSTNNIAGPGADAGSTLATSYGTRVLSTFVAANQAPGDARARTAINNDRLTYSSDEEVQGAGSVAYNFTTPVDFSNEQSFQLDFLSNDLPGSVGVEITDSSTGFSQTIATLPTISSSTEISLENVFASVDATHITKLQFFFGGTTAEDLQLDSISSVPEPTTASFLAIAGLGLLARRRRRNRSI